MNKTKLRYSAYAIFALVDIAALNLMYQMSYPDALPVFFFFAIVAIGGAYGFGLMIHGLTQ